MRSPMLLVVLALLFATGNSSAASFNIRNDGTVLDRESGLIWQQQSSEKMPWLEAVRYCNQLELADSRGWRLPFRDELVSLVNNVGAGQYLDNSAFADMAAEVYWSLSREEQQPDQVWGVSFADGKAYMFDRHDFSFSARCLIETAEAVYLPLLNKWRGAWSAQDVEGYLSCYGQEFAPEKGTREEWAEQRRNRLLKPKSIEVTVSNIKVLSEQGNRAEIRFRQRYKSDNYADEVVKVLTLGLERGELVIVAERTISKVK
ncbi:Protein of unknown function [Malonomonas rubra DSM 5091]|uniref:DUF1566 domain-containing protein n=1 Tax=Malonomonas rubra DSM 5091 TaxID=1122189 RepID=A0A1M6CEB9_MALRU|nr:DUF1566 domain-containing protein [Malonomonas rubra]SHI59347.1 Protein of unknown function [Malonomonas rubra DSM 5091]